MQKTPAALALTGLVFLATPAFGDRLDPHAVPSTTRFLVHFDVDAMQGTEFGKALFTGAEEKGREPLVELEGFEEDLGLDPLRDIRSLTLFGPAPDSDAAVGMIVGDAKIDDALVRLEQEDGYSSVEVEGLRLRVLEREDEFLYGYVHRRGDERIVLVSADQKELVRSALVLRGRGPSLADLEEPILDLRPGPGSFLYVASAGELPGMDGVEPASAVLGLTKSFTFDLGEAEGVLTARLAFATASEENARNVLDILQGVVAIARLASGMEDVPVDVPRELLDGIECGVEGKTVSVRLSWATGDLLRLVGEAGAFD